MKIRIVKIGRVAYPELTSLASVYEERLKAFASVESVLLKDDEAAERHLAALPPRHHVVMLDERGKEPTSRELAQQVARWMDDPGVLRVVLVIGGPLGLPARLKASGTATLCLSRATLTSDMAWLLLWEQLYRAFTILRGTPYHHD